jgi:hypothetical protein
MNQNHSLLQGKKKWCNYNCPRSMKEILFWSLIFFLFFIPGPRGFNFLYFDFKPLWFFFYFFYTYPHDFKFLYFDFKTLFSRVLYPSCWDKRVKVIKEKKRRKKELDKWYLAHKMLIFMVNIFILEKRFRWGDFGF